MGRKKNYLFPQFTPIFFNIRRVHERHISPSEFSSFFFFTPKDFSTVLFCHFFTILKSFEVFFILKIYSCFFFLFFSFLLLIHCHERALYFKSYVFSLFFRYF